MERLFKKYDISFYDSYAFNGEPPNISLNSEIFYGGFALGNVSNMQPFVDDSIYYVKAYFIRGVKIGKEWKYEQTPLEIEKCKLEKFGEQYRDLFKDKSIENLYCISDINHTLEGHTTYDIYSYFQISFYPCVHASDNNCKPLEIVKRYLTRTFLTFKMEDIDLTPQLYNSPVARRAKEVTANVWANLFQDVHSFFQVTNIETDKDIYGINFSQNVKKEKYVKYDQSVILSSLVDGTVFVTGGPLCTVTIALSEKELTQTRTYKKLVELIGDLGGIMEVILSFFKVISLMLTETLYETSLINHLFSFDLERKVLIIKEKISKLEDNTPNIYNPLVNKSTQISIRPNDNKKGKRIFDNHINHNNNLINKKTTINKGTNTKKIIKKKKIKIKVKTPKSQIKCDNTDLKSILSGIDIKTSNIDNNIFYSNTKLKSINKHNNHETKGERKNHRGWFVKIKMNKICLYLCFCCARKRKNVQNILLDEGMKVIKENLDLLNIFQKISKMKENDEIKEQMIDMSQECKYNLQSIDIEKEI